jgi:hypothetical protein
MAATLRVVSNVDHDSGSKLPAPRRSNTSTARAERRVSSPRLPKSLNVSPQTRTTKCRD